MPGRQRGAFAGRPDLQITVRHAAIPEFDNAPLGTHAGQCGAAEHVHGQDAFELGIHLAQDFRQAIAFGRHAVEHLRQRHGADGGGQPMAGEVAQQHVGIAGGGVGRQ